MSLIDIDHVEFHVGDAWQAAFYLCTAFGFRRRAQAGPETGLAGHRSVLLRQGRIQLLLTSPLTRSGPLVDRLAEHGDSVAVIALRTDDARAAFDEARRRGAGTVAEPVEYSDGQATVVVAEVTGFGDVTHRFVERRGGADRFMPGVLVPDTTAAADGDVASGASGGDVLEAIDHIAVCLPVGDLDAVVDRYRRIFGLRETFEETITVGAQTMRSKVVQNGSGEITLTLLEPDPSGQPGQIDDFLRGHGSAGVQHLAFRTDDIIGAVSTLEGRGVRFLTTPDAYYADLPARLGPPQIGVDELRRTNVLADRDHWGEIFQIFTRSMHVRNTYFMEVIERRGALTFGSGNIGALYAAVDRERSETTLIGASAAEAGAAPLG
jgi:4-hydroxymandelate synthase